MKLIENDFRSRNVYSFKTSMNLPINLGFNSWITDNIIGTFGNLFDSLLDIDTIIEMEFRYGID